MSPTSTFVDEINETSFFLVKAEDEVVNQISEKPGQFRPSHGGLGPKLEPVPATNKRSRAAGNSSHPCDRSSLTANVSDHEVTWEDLEVSSNHPLMVDRRTRESNANTPIPVCKSYYRLVLRVKMNKTGKIFWQGDHRHLELTHKNLEILEHLEFILISSHCNLCGIFHPASKTLDYPFFGIYGGVGWENRSSLF